MVDVDSVRSAAEVINSVLFAKGFFQDSEQTQKLLFRSIDTIEDNDESIIENDKIVINTIYSLLQELEKNKNDKVFLNDQINDKKEIISHVQLRNKELTNTNQNLVLKNNQLNNEVNLLKLQLKKTNNEKLLAERNISKEKNLSSSIKLNAAKELKRKNLMINSLQDKLINRKRKYENIIMGNNPVSSEPPINSSKDTLLLDNEMEKMMINLSNLITNLTLQNDKNINFINFIINYLNILNDHLLRRSSSHYESDQLVLPPTPRFYHDKFQNELQNQLVNQQQHNDISSKIAQIIDFQKLQPLFFKTLDKFYEIITTTNDYNHIDQGHKTFDNNNNELKLEIEKLQENLRIALETNDKWSRKFQAMNKESKSK